MQHVGKRIILHAAILQLDEADNPVRAFQLENLWVLFYSFIIHFVIIALGPTCFDDFGCNDGKEIERDKNKTSQTSARAVLPDTYS